MKRVFAIILVLILLVSLVSCTMGAPVVGKWYNSRGKCLHIRSDGSWKLEDSYGTGTWKHLGDGLYEFTDFYGDTQESEINRDKLGEYIDFGYYGDFYRDIVPDED